MSEMYSRIEELCREKGITVGKMCSELGIPRANLTELKMERTKSLRYETLKKIAVYYNTSVEYLTFGTTHTTPTEESSFTNAEQAEHLLSATEENLTAAMKFCTTDEGKYTIEKLLQLTFAERRRVLDYIERVLAE